MMPEQQVDSTLMKLRAIIAMTIGAGALAPGLTARTTVSTPAQADATSIVVPASGLKWRNIGPFRAGRVAAVAGAIGDRACSTSACPFGGVWKTTSAGTTWFPVFDAVKDVSSIGSIEVAPSDPNIVYAGTGDLYRAA